jgi:hypothetical protein
MGAMGVRGCGLETESFRIGADVIHWRLSFRQILGLYNYDLPMLYGCL